MTTDIPILMSGPMVRASLRHIDTKVQTRRDRGLENLNAMPDLYDKPARVYVKDGYTWADFELDDDGILRTASYRCPYGAAGGRLWVRENYSADFARHYPHDRFWYQADDDRKHDIETRNGVRGIWSPESQQFAPFKWRPSIHMPREACRLRLELTDVRIERLKDISEADCLAEGIQPYRGPLRWVKHLDAVTGEASHLTARDAYFALWDHLNGTGSVELNPWLWVLSFRRLEASHG